MSLFGRWSKDDDDYRDKVTRSARNELNARLISAREAYEKNPTPAAHAAMNAAEDELRGLG